MLAQGGLPIDLVERVEKAFQDLHANSLKAALRGPSLKLEGNAVGADEYVIESADFFALSMKCQEQVLSQRKHCIFKELWEKSMLLPEFDRKMTDDKLLTEMPEADWITEEEKIERVRQDCDVQHARGSSETP